MYKPNIADLIHVISDIIANSQDDQKVLEAYSSRAAIYRDLGQSDSAIADFSECIRRMPTNLDFYKERALLHAAEKRPAEALKDLTHIIETVPDGWTYANRGAIYVRLGKYDIAIQDLQMALQHGNITVQVYFNWGLAHHHKGEFRLAISGFDDALSIDRDYYQAIMQRGMAHSRLGEYESALENYERALEINPDYINGTNNLAWLLATCPKQSVRDGTRALRLAKKACAAVGWTNGHYMSTFAAACAEVGNFRDAILWQEKALEAPCYDSKPDELKKARFCLKLYQENKAFQQDMYPKGLS
jgi:tetratricopeptide (TPR) repeat protein